MYDWNQQQKKSKNGFIILKKAGNHKKNESSKWYVEVKVNSYKRKNCKNNKITKGKSILIVLKKSDKYYIRKSPTLKQK